MCEIELVAEIPVSRQRAEPSWPTGICRLLIYGSTVSNEDDRRRKFSEILFTLAQGRRHVVAYPMGLLISDGQVAELVRAVGADSGTTEVFPGCWLVHLVNAESALKLMDERGIEEIAFLLVAQVEDALAIVQRAQALTDECADAYTTPLVRQCGTGTRCIFYSFAHDNLEVLGNQGFVVDECFLPLAANR